MALPPNLHKKYLDRFDALIQEGERIYQIVQKIKTSLGIVSKSLPSKFQDIQETEALNKFREWIVNYESLLDQVIPANNIHRRLIEREEKFYNSTSRLAEYLSRLKGLREDFDQGFLGDLTLQIEAEVAADYMGQAEQLLAEGQTGQYDHVPAGAVLEKGLRTLCSKQTPPIPVVHDKGYPFTMNRLIDDLRKVNAFNEPNAKHLRAWADIRNAAAHGQFGEFTRTQVEGMIKGVSDFLATHIA